MGVTSARAACRPMSGVKGPAPEPSLHHPDLGSRLPDADGADDGARGTSERGAWGSGFKRRSLRTTRSSVRQRLRAAQ